MDRSPFASRVLHSREGDLLFGEATLASYGRTHTAPLGEVLLPRGQWHTVTTNRSPCQLRINFYTGADNLRLCSQSLSWRNRLPDEPHSILRVSDTPTLRLSVSKSWFVVVTGEVATSLEFCTF